MGIYLDNAATSYPKPESVYLAMDATSRDVGVSPGRGSHRRGLEAGRIVLAAREEAASLFGIPDSKRVIFTHSATEAINLAVLGLLKPGDGVVTTSMEHNSLARPLHLAARRGVEITWIVADHDGYISPNEVAAAVNPKTRLVALSHCSNVTGAIQPIAEIGEIVRKSDAVFLVDAAQSAGSIPIDVKEMSIDLLAAPGHKGLYGPQGTGFLYIAEGVALEPIIVGGTGTASNSKEQPEELPERYESGTINTTGIAGLLEGLKFVRSIGVDAVGRHEAGLIRMLLEELKDMPKVKVHGHGDQSPHGGIVSLTVSGMDPGEVGFMLDQEYDIAVRTGLHCAPAAHRTIGTYPEGTLRVSPGYFNSEDDISAFINALRSITTRGK